MNQKDSNEMRILDALEVLSRGMADHHPAKDVLSTLALINNRKMSRSSFYSGVGRLVPEGKIKKESRGIYSLTTAGIHRLEQLEQIQKNEALAKSPIEGWRLTMHTHPVSGTYAFTITVPYEQWISASVMKTTRPIGEDLARKITKTRLEELTGLIQGLFSFYLYHRQASFSVVRLSTDTIMVKASALKNLRDDKYLPMLKEQIFKAVSVGKQ